MSAARWWIEQFARRGECFRGDGTVTGAMEPVLVLAFGNPGRQDDGLGPAAAEMLAGHALPGVTVEADYQLMVEDAARIAEHAAVVFIDAARGGPEPFCLEPVRPVRVAPFSSHASQPGALLALAAELDGVSPPGFLMAIRGYEFDHFDEQLSEGARRNLKLAVQCLAELLGHEHSARLVMLERYANQGAAGCANRLAAECANQVIAGCANRLAAECANHVAAERANQVTAEQEEIWLADR